MYRIWYSDEQFGKYIYENTILFDFDESEIKWSKIYESDASNPSNFHGIPDHIKNILYLDAPDLIIEKDSEPIVSIEVTTEAGTGHNAFQRFGRIAAAIENQVPALYIYPKAVYVQRKGDNGRWDMINPNIFKALEKTIRIYDIPALLFYFPTKHPEEPLHGKGIIYDNEYIGCPDRNSDEMKKLFETLNLILTYGKKQVNEDIKIINKKIIKERLDWMQEQYSERGGYERVWSPDTSTMIVPTESIINYMQKFTSDGYNFGELLSSRKETLIYHANAYFRGDPYPGALAALDYLHTRTGKTYEDRDLNLIMAWGNVSYDKKSGEINIKSKSKNDKKAIDAMIDMINKVADKFILDKNYEDINDSEIPRFYMQIRHGTAYSLRKEIRMFSYFADAIIFEDGALWREG